MYCLTVKGLDAKRNALTKELDYGIVGNREYFGEYLKEWLYNTQFVNKKPSTKEMYDGLFRNYIKNSPLYSIKLGDMTALDIQDYYNSLVKKNKTSVDTVKAIHKIIAPCIRYAYNNNKIFKDFSKSVVIPRVQGKTDEIDEVNPFTREEQKFFIKAISGEDLEALYITAMDTGMRQGELFALTWDDIDFKKGTIRINKSYKLVKDIESGSYSGIVDDPKNYGSIRTIPIPKHLSKVLTKHKIDQKAHKLKMANLYLDKNLVFCNIFGNYLDSSNVLKNFKKVLAANNLPEKKFHDLRHTYATRLFELGENAKTVQKLLGHRNLNTTLNTYTHVLDAMKEQAVTKIDDLYERWGSE